MGAAAAAEAALIARVSVFAAPRPAHGAFLTFALLTRPLRDAAALELAQRLAAAAARSDCRSVATAASRSLCPSHFPFLAVLWQDQGPRLDRRAKQRSHDGQLNHEIHVIEQTLKS